MDNTDLFVSLSIKAPYFTIFKLIFNFKIYISPIIHCLLNAVGDLIFLLFAKRVYGYDIAYKATFCRVILWFTIYASSRSLTNSLEEFFTIICLSLLKINDEVGERKKNKSRKESYSFWLFHIFAFSSFIFRATAAINLIPIYVYQFVFLCSSIKARVYFLIQFVMIG